MKIMVIFQEYIHVHVRDVNMLWSSMFKIMEDIRDEFPAVEDYSISETSLEQVFISFAKNQKSNSFEHFVLYNQGHFEGIPETTKRPKADQGKHRQH